MARRRRDRFEGTIEWVLRACAGVSVLVTVGILSILSIETIRFFREVSPFEFLFGTVWTPLFFQQSFGVLPLVVGTLLVTAIALAVALPRRAADRHLSQRVRAVEGAPERQAGAGDPRGPADGGVRLLRAPRRHPRSCSS